MEKMEIILTLFILIPFLGFLVSITISAKNENLISWVTFCTTGLQHVLAMLFVGYWIYLGGDAINVKEFVIYKTSGYEFFIDLYFDQISAVYLLVGSLLTFLITVYSRNYLHREDGYKRFFNTILFFYFSYNIIIFSGNFETLFIGWEILGVSSFLLIGFYRQRYLPVRNAFKVFSYYRLADIAIILAMWMSHHLWHHNVTFYELNNYTIVDAELQSHFSMGLFISLMILIAACVKSAQFPFSSWLPRAMEGPTPSSAIFYGSLAVNIGVFILLRTMPFWEHQMLFRWIVAIVGLVSSIAGSYAARVQSSVKSQIAYSSISQIGLIFIEVALGFETLALIHFAGNAFMRSYQLLVSPSVVTYLIREQQYNFTSESKDQVSGFNIKFRNSLYVLSIKEWNLDTYMFRFLWNPMKAFGKMFGFISTKVMLVLLPSIFCFGLYLHSSNSIAQYDFGHLIPVFFAFIGLIVVAISFKERYRVQLSWVLAASGHFWIALAVSFNEQFSFSHTVIYLAGVVVSVIVGSIILKILMSKEKGVDLNEFHGHVYEHKWWAFIFLLACLGLAGFPISSTFLGEDLIYSHIHEDQFILTLVISVCMIINGLSVMRIYSRVFLGPHSKNYHEIPHRAS
jgi:NADH-quinone oxidoreductase subunit L